MNGGVSYLESSQVDLLLEPNCVEVEAQRGPVAFVMAPEIMHQHFIDFVLRAVRRARIHHSARVFLINNNKYVFRWINSNIPIYNK